MAEDDLNILTHGDAENGFIIEVTDGERHMIHAGMHDDEEGAVAEAKRKWRGEEKEPALVKEDAGPAVEATDREHSHQSGWGPDKAPGKSIVASVPGDVAGKLQAMDEDKHQRGEE